MLCIYLKQKLKDVEKKTYVKKSVEVEEFYDLGEVWHIAIDQSIDNLADDERITSIELIAW